MTTSKFDIPVHVNEIISGMAGIFKCSPKENIESKYEFFNAVDRNEVDGFKKQNGLEALNNNILNLSCGKFFSFCTSVLRQVIKHNMEECTFDGTFTEQIQKASEKMDELNPDMKGQQKYVIMSCRVELENLSKILSNNGILTSIFPIGLVGDVCVYIDAYMPMGDKSMYMCYGAELNYDDNDFILKKSNTFVDPETSQLYKKKQVPENVTLTPVYSYSAKWPVELLVRNCKYLKF